MGRTSRKRKRKRKDAQITSLNSEDKFFFFIKWFLSEGWRPTRKLTVSTFPVTGRGVMANEKITPNSTIVRIPGHLLITVKTVSESLIGNIIKKAEMKFTSQHILTLFLIWEKHLGIHSFWYRYLITLPEKYTSPLFTDIKNVDKFPNFIKERVDDMNRTIHELYKSVHEIFKKINCQHCGKNFLVIFTEEIYKWGWFTVNSRSVYMNPEKNFGHNIQLYDKNCLALAPFLDMFNHSNNAIVNASFNASSNCYEIKTLVSYEQNDEVFVHYGDLSNLKLYLEYGFILNNNNNDLIIFDSCDFEFEKFKCSKNDYKRKINYLKSKKILCDLYCSSEGLSWNMCILCYVFTSHFNFDDNANKKIYSGNFTRVDWQNISKIGKTLIENKLIQYQSYLCDIDDNESVDNYDEILTIACNLIKEYINIIRLCKVKLDENL